MTLDIIIPVFNESEVVTTTLSRIQEVVFPSFITHVNIVIVNDCSTDGSGEVIEKYILGKTNMHLYTLPKNSGKGAAVRYGISKSDGDLIVIQDADLELTPSDIPSMLLAMKAINVQFVNGSRYLAGIPRPLASYRRYIINKLFTWLTSLLINVRLTDMACGYKLFHRELYNQLQLKENRFGFESEILIKSLKIGKNNITEVPVNYFPRNKGEGKKIRPIDGFKILWSLFKHSIFK